MMERPTCDGCAYFDFLDGTDGACRRLAPRPTTIAAEDGPSYAWFPIVQVDHWCGEHSEFARYLATLDDGRHAAENQP